MYMKAYPRSFYKAIMGYVKTGLKKNRFNVVWSVWRHYQIHILESYKS